MERKLNEFAILAPQEEDNVIGLGHTEDDNEGAMAKADLYKLATYSFKLFKKLEDNDQLESWVQAKITKAADYIASVYHYIEYEKKFSEYGDHLENSDIYSESQKAALKNKLMEAKAKIKELKITEAKKNKSDDAPKINNFVAKNAPTAGAGAHKDKKQAAKRGDEKHKKTNYDLGESTLTKGSRKIASFDDNSGGTAEVRAEGPGNGFTVHIYKDGKHLGPKNVSRFDDKKEAIAHAKHEVGMDMGIDEATNVIDRKGNVLGRWDGKKHWFTPHSDEHEEGETIPRGSLIDHSSKSFPHTIINKKKEREIAETGLSKDTLKSYTKRATRDIDNKAYRLGKMADVPGSIDKFGELNSKIQKRKKGIEKAVDNLEESLNRKSKPFKQVSKEGKEKGDKIAAKNWAKKVKFFKEQSENISEWETDPEEHNSAVKESWYDDVVSAIKDLGVELPVQEHEIGRLVDKLSDEFSDILPHYVIDQIVKIANFEAEYDADEHETTDSLENQADAEAVFRRDAARDDRYERDLNESVELDAIKMLSGLK